MEHKTHEVDVVTYHRELAHEHRAIETKLFADKLRSFANETVRFIITAAVIFVIAFVGMNFSAYEKQVEFWFSGLTSGTLKSDIVATPTPDVTLPTDSTKNEPAVAPTIESPLPVSLTNKVEKKNIKIPTINVDVEPPTSFLFIPRLNIRAPVLEAEGVDFIGDWSYVEKQIQKTLQKGVVHFPGTAQPGERGNAFITGHSSFYPWDPGRYKDIFALLPKIDVGDTIEAYHGEQKFTYRVTSKREVSPKATDVLAPTDDYRLTLMTCTPVGTALQRLIVTAELINNTTNARVALAR